MAQWIILYNLHLELDYMTLCLHFHFNLNCKCEDRPRIGHLILPETELNFH